METVKTLTDLINYSSKYNILDVAFLSTDLYGNTTIQTTQVDRYYKIITSYISDYDVSYDQREKYKYRPDLLSTAIYGVPNLAWLILKLNSYETASRFIVRNKIKLIPPKTLQSVFTELKSKDVSRIEKNHKDNNIN